MSKSQAFPTTLVVITGPPAAGKTTTEQMCLQMGTGVVVPHYRVRKSAKDDVTEIGIADLDEDDILTSATGFRGGRSVTMKSDVKRLLDGEAPMVVLSVLPDNLGPIAAFCRKEQLPLKIFYLKPPRWYRTICRHIGRGDALLKIIANMARYRPKNWEQAVQEGGRIAELLSEPAIFIEPTTPRGVYNLILQEIIR